MEENYDSLIETLEKSVEKNGEQPLTNAWLLNIVKLARELSERKSDNDYPSSYYDIF